MVLHRLRGVALLVTLSMIALISVLIFVSFDQVIKLRLKKDSNDRLVEYPIIISNIKDMLNSYFSLIEDPDILYQITDVKMPLEIGGGLGTLSLELTPASGGFNPNWLKVKNTSTSDEDGNTSDQLDSTVILSTWYNILSNINVKYPDILTKAVQNVLESSLINVQSGAPVYYYGDIRSEYPFFMKGKIYNLDQFRKILEYYYLQTKDSGVFYIQWENYLSFQNDSLNINYVSPEVLQALIPSMSISQAVSLSTNKSYAYTDIDDMGLVESEVEELKKIPITFLDFYFTCNLYIQYDDVSKNTSFDYLDGKISNIRIPL